MVYSLGTVYYVNPPLQGEVPYFVPFFFEEKNRSGVVKQWFTASPFFFEEKNRSGGLILTYLRF